MSQNKSRINYAKCMALKSPTPKMYVGTLMLRKQSGESVVLTEVFEGTSFGELAQVLVRKLCTSEPTETTPGSGGASVVPAYLPRDRKGGAL
jgi:hypothetical protein